ncbi:uncharacterized protein LOC108741707 [Agrilus planipennis]|uniref:Uncharacterized protein LOC108741707 n=1 Tax=Agrilus planipennis TaxID=224129 RepID=A0A1W4X7L9_AGRPL|nr:uncharacterized protein LOC108741707 [Agrilus planipennis]
MSISNGYGENDCRLCGKACNFSDTHNIFEKTEEGVQLVQLIKDFLPILIYRTDPLSKQVCELCCSNLKNFCEFKKKCLAYFNEQKGKLESKVDINENEKLFLNTISNSTCSTRKNGLTDSQHFDESDNQQSESELCAELQNAIKESLTQIQMEEKRQQQAVCSIKVATNLTNCNENVINGNLEDESSQDSFYHTKANSTNSESHSDMELCDSPATDMSVVHNKHVSTEPAIKRRKLIGPKSCMERLRKKYGYSPLREIEKEVDPVIYNPLSLLNCILNYFNKTNIPDYEYQNYTTCTLSSLQEWEVFEDFDKESTCRHCNMVFKNLKMVAEHELQHLYVVEKEKVDSPNFTISNGFHKRVHNVWLKNINKTDETEEPDVVDFENDHNYEDENVRDELIRNGDINVEKPIEEIIDEEDQGLLVPVEKSSDGSTKGEVVLIDTIAMVNGTPLSEIPKDLRRTMFKSVTVNGVKRKFCSLCRYTFKDNWAIESHYFSSGCHYTCRFCGLRFNKQRAEFDDHIKNHILNGDKRTDKIFASRKAHLPPKVINQSRLKAKPAYIPSKPIPKITPHKIKAMFKEIEQDSQKMKKETNSNIAYSEKSSSVDPYKPQNQAYFCRKCYQVFFKLDEFNVHVVSCNGTGMATVTEANNARYYNRNSSHISPRFSAEGSKSDTESYSPSGRPIRHCVKEAGPYVDGSEVDEALRPKTAVMNNTLPTERGYECSLCSSCFPTKYSRNSHMRIHKNDYGLKKLSDHSITISRNRQENVAKKVINMVEQNNIPTYTKYVNNVRIKQEPTEPIVEIHEGEAENMNIPSSIGSVSITPIPNANHKTNVDPDIIRLVQSNPNITIKTMSRSNSNDNEQYYMQGGSGFFRNAMTMGNSTPNNSSQDNDGRCYRCSSCSKPFANKSNLYFHKKHQCTGSKYPCPFCRKRFGTEAAYSSHIFYNHPE